MTLQDGSSVKLQREGADESFCLRSHHLVVKLLADGGLMDQGHRERAQCTLVANLCMRSGDKAEKTPVPVAAK